MSKYYITLPIYYANGDLHIWHAYTSFIGDIIARYQRLQWFDVKFSVGTDENSQKIVQKAESLGVDTMAYLDEMAEKHKAVWSKLQITNTDFIRTTEERHKKYVQSILTKAFDNWDFYQKEYKWLYCVWCEWFKKEADLIISDGKFWRPVWEKICADHPHEALQNLVENNWFFKLSKYEDYIKELYISNPNFVQPDFRFNEIKAFVDGWLEDFSISRQWATFWIPLPFDPTQITYVWYDALLNYNTVCQDWDEDFRPVDLQVLWKDIIRFHSIYYPAMLKSVWILPPKHQIINWFLTADWQKISKSLWNVIDPIQLLEDYDRDALAMYLIFDVKIGSDWDFSQKRFDEMYASMLIGWRGNLVARVTKLSEKNNITKINSDAITSRLQKYISDLKENHDHTNILLNVFDWKSVSDTISHYISNFDLQWLLRDRYTLVQAANKFLNDSEPWQKMKDETKKEEWLADLQFALYLIKNLSILIAPLLINSFSKIQEMLGIPALSKIDTTTTADPSFIQSVFDITETSVELKPVIIYQQKARVAE